LRRFCARRGAPQEAERWTDWSMRWETLKLTRSVNETITSARQLTHQMAMGSPKENTKEKKYPFLRNERHIRPEQKDSVPIDQYLDDSPLASRFL
jgi:hypothetical protein